MSDIPTLHKEIIELFKKYKIDWETNKLPLESIQKWSYSAAELLTLEKEFIRKRFSEIYWALFSSQLSLGYMLLSRQTCQHLKGAKGEVFSQNDIPNFFNVSEIHFFYHLNNAWESLYRCWERLTSVLDAIVFPNEKRKIYFNDLIDLIDVSPQLCNFKSYNRLRKQIKYWNKVANERNKISHKESSPMKKIELDTSISYLYNSKSEYVPKVNYSFTNLLNEINKVKENYSRIVPAVIVVKEFCEEFIQKKVLI